MNYLGCALGGSVEPALDVAIETLAPVLRRPPRERARPRRALRRAARGALERHRLARPRVRRHAAEELHPSERAGRLGAVRLRERESGVGPRLRARVHPGVRGRNRGSATPCIRRTTRPAGTSPSTTGVFGAAAAIGKLLGLTTQQMVWAFGLAATQAAGHPRDVRLDGEVVSAGPRRAERLHGRAARPRRTSRPESARSKGRAASRRCTAAQYDLGKVTARLGVDFELRDNAYKPYACGLVVHPDDRRLQPAAPRASTRRPARSPPCACASRRWCSTSATRATSSARSRASTPIYHARGDRARARQGRLAGVHRRGDRATRARARAQRDDRRRRSVDHRGPGAHRGRRSPTARSSMKFVEQSLGNMHRPLSNEQITEKFVDQAVLALPRDASGRRRRAVLAHRRARRRGRLARATVPRTGTLRRGLRAPE